LAVLVLSSTELWLKGICIKGVRVNYSEDIAFMGEKNTAKSKSAGATLYLVVMIFVASEVDGFPFSSSLRPLFQGGVRDPPGNAVPSLRESCSETVDVQRRGQPYEHMGYTE
jgi:hypothetical protein